MGHLHARIRFQLDPQFVQFSISCVRVCVILSLYVYIYIYIRPPGLRRGDDAGQTVLVLGGWGVVLECSAVCGVGFDGGLWDAAVHNLVANMPMIIFVFSSFL